jgi:thiamine-monophosphate kinase
VPSGDDPPQPPPDGPRVGGVGERGLIERVRRRPAARRPDRPPGPGVLLGIGDDAAAVTTDGRTVLLLTTDALVEGVHFRRETAAFRDVGAKALAVNLSDIAAMGGEPRYALLALALPAETPLADVEALYEGLDEMAGRHGVELVGGDTCASPDRIFLSVTVVGTVAGAPLSRRGARPGDAILVTGSLGAAAAGLAVLDRPTLAVGAAEAGAVRDAHRRPVPRVAEGQRIRASGTATAMIDLSDGLATDLGHIAAESGVAAVVELAAVPIAAATRAVAAAAGVPPERWALSGGEDYELLFTAAADTADRLAAEVSAATGTPVRRIGRIEAGAGPRFLDREGRPVAVAAGFDHFARRPA